MSADSKKSIMNHNPNNQEPFLHRSCDTSGHIPIIPKPELRAFLLRQPLLVLPFADHLGGYNLAKYMISFYDSCHHGRSLNNKLAARSSAFFGLQVTQLEPVFHHLDIFDRGI